MLRHTEQFGLIITDLYASCNNLIFSQWCKLNEAHKHKIFQLVSLLLFALCNERVHEIKTTLIFRTKLVSQWKYPTEMQRTASTSRPEASTDEEQNNEKTETPVAGWSECNVCFDVAKDPVVGSCGHLFWLVIIDVSYRLFTVVL